MMSLSFSEVVKGYRICKCGRKYLDACETCSNTCQCCGEFFSNGGLRESWDKSLLCKECSKLEGCVCCGAWIGGGICRYCR